MQSYIRLFIGLLLPLTLLFSVLSVFYFTFDYTLAKAIRLGVISGVLLGITISLGMALLLTILRSLEKNKKIHTKDVLETQTAVPVSTKLEQKTISKETKCMLLLDKELSFDIIIITLKKNKDYILASSNLKKGTLSIKTKEGIIEAVITAVTRHTSQIILQTQESTEAMKDLILVLKEKETSFLQY